ncbi:MAG: M50 family metallopeptidase [Gemmatimonadota bacterium]|nr:M50 family metallopeptidase [Gemmatimonadota bacterium]MDH5760649.1 M50 family metallopeptidase [Gemmatimonadota bacterium]
MAGNTERKLRFLAGFSIYFAALWFFWDTPIAYPLKIFVVLLHEVSHGVVALATGGSIQAIVLNPYEGGACLCPGGNALLTLSAGYLGSLGWGVLLSAAAWSKRIRANFMVGFLGGLVVAITALYVRSLFGILFGVAFGMSLLWISRAFSDGLNRSILLTLGMTSTLYAILDIKSDVLDRPHLRSDARMLSELTGIPTLTWGVIWISVALVVTAFVFRRAYRKA